MTKIKESTMTVGEKKKVQERLNSILGIHLAIDGNFGGENSETRKALRKILSYLSKLGAYEGDIDGRYGDLTNAALSLYQQCANNLTVRLKSGNTIKIRWNLLDPSSVEKAFTSLSKYVKGNLKLLDGHVINFSAKDAALLWLMYINNQLNYLDISNSGSGRFSKLLTGFTNLKQRAKRSIRNAMANSDDPKLQAAVLYLI